MSNTKKRRRMTKKWWKNAEPLYRRFGTQGRDADEACEMFMAETYGGPQPSPATNRYAAGKRNMDATVEMWREDIPQGMLMKFELLEDKTFGGPGLQRWIQHIVTTIEPGTNALLRTV